MATKTRFPSTQATPRSPVHTEGMASKTRFFGGRGIPRSSARCGRVVWLRAPCLPYPPSPSNPGRTRRGSKRISLHFRRTPFPAYRRLLSPKSRGRPQLALAPAAHWSQSRPLFGAEPYDDSLLSVGCDSITTGSQVMILDQSNDGQYRGDLRN